MSISSNLKSKILLLLDSVLTDTVLADHGPAVIWLAQNGWHTGVYHPGPDKITNLKVTDLSNHMSEQGITRNIEGYTQNTSALRW